MSEGVTVLVLFKVCKHRGSGVGWTNSAGGSRLFSTSGSYRFRHPSFVLVFLPLPPFLVLCYLVGVALDVPCAPRIWVVFPAPGGLFFGGGGSGF